MRLQAEFNGLEKNTERGWGAITWDTITTYADVLKPKEKVSAATKASRKWVWYSQRVKRGVVP